ncbi:MAG: DedA family protein, partial [Planctomycetia bacterium]|nr:DedA family protein [Planctomycetia bacterium]
MFDWFERGSYLGIVLFLALTGIGLPIPEEVAIVAAGAASRAQALHWPYALLSCMVGALLGDSLMYAIGRFFGARVLREHPWWSGFLTPEREKTIEDLIKRHGIKAFFVARFLVGLRSPFYLTAGILRVKYRWFLFADFICATVVIGGFFGLAYLFGDRITVLIQSAERGFTAVALIMALVSLAVIAFFSFRKRRIRMLDQDPEALFENREILLGPAADRIAVVDLAVDFRHDVRRNLIAGFQVVTSGARACTVDSVVNHLQITRIRVGWCGSIGFRDHGVGEAAVDEARFRQMLPRRDMFVDGTAADDRFDTAIVVAVLASRGARNVGGRLAVIAGQSAEAVEEAEVSGLD